MRNVKNILSQDQIGFPKPACFQYSKKCEDHIVSKPNELNRLNKKCEKIYYFKVNPAHFRNQNALLSIFNSQVTVFLILTKCTLEILILVVISGSF